MQWAFWRRSRIWFIKEICLGIVICSCCILTLLASHTRAFPWLRGLHFTWLIAKSSNSSIQRQALRLVQREYADAQRTAIGVGCEDNTRLLNAKVGQWPSMPGCGIFVPLSTIACIAFDRPLGSVHREASPSGSSREIPTVLVVISPFAGNGEPHRA
jgi:hypothetical protein